jgi:hypothetical protein
MKILHLKLLQNASLKRFTDYLETLQNIQNWLLSIYLN